MIVVDGRVVYPSTYRPSTFLDLAATVEWYRSLGLLGLLLGALGAAVAVNGGAAAAVVGVGLFFATAVLAGQDRIELATALGTAGVVWTAIGISLTLGSVGPRTAVAVVLVALGAAAVLLALAGGRSIDARSRSAPPTGP